MTHSEETPRFINIKRKNFQLTRYHDRKIYVLQKTFFYNDRWNYLKIGFDDDEVIPIAELLFKIKKFRTYFVKLLKSDKLKKKVETNDTKNE